MNTETQIKFSPIVVGTMRLGKWGENLDTKALETFIDQCLERDLIDFDHADIYGDYTTESDFGKVLKKRPDLKKRVELITKCGIKLVGKNRPNHHLKSYDSSKKHILSSVDQSLQNFGVDQIKLLLIHRPDYLMNPYEVAEAFEMLSKDGKVKNFGVSNFTPSQFNLLNEFFPLAVNQIEFSLSQLNPLDNGTLDQCFQKQVRPMAWSPLGGGEMFKKVENQKIQRIQEMANEIGRTHQIGMDQVLLSWLIKHPSNAVPVVGSSKIERLEKAKHATRIQLSNEEWYQLLEAAKGKEVA